MVLGRLTAPTLQEGTGRSTWQGGLTRRCVAMVQVDKVQRSQSRDTTLQVDLTFVLQLVVFCPRTAPDPDPFILRGV